MTDLLPIVVRDAARHGSYCPKLCTFACPVAEATGRDDAVPWSFHRTVTDLGDGRLAPEDAAPRLQACTGCLACREPCVFDQDVPAQVVAGRAIAPPETPQALEALAHLAAGRRPDGSSAPRRVGPDDAEVVVVAGHADTPEAMAAAAALFGVGERSVAVVAPTGCCGALARALGDPSLAEELNAGVPALVGAAAQVVAMDPHCLSDLRALLPDREVVDASTALVRELPRLRFRPAGTRIAWHDPCLLARGEGVIDPPRNLLAAAGFAVAEPPHHGREVMCSGAGLGMPLIDPDAAAATASRRAGELQQAAPHAVTGCRRAADALNAAGTPTADLLVLLASHLEND